jgi:homeobox protein cut-like
MSFGTVVTCEHLAHSITYLFLFCTQILIGDAERLREELADVVRERDGLRLKMGMFDSKADDATDGIESAPPSGGVKLSEFMSERRAYEAEIVELSDTCNALREELRVKEETAADDRR